MEVSSPESVAVVKYVETRVDVLPAVDVLWLVGELSREQYPLTLAHVDPGGQPLCVLATVNTLTQPRSNYRKNITGALKTHKTYTSSDTTPTPSDSTRRPAHYTPARPCTHTRCRNTPRSTRHTATRHRSGPSSDSTPLRPGYNCLRGHSTLADSTVLPCDSILWPSSWGRLGLGRCAVGGG